MELQKYLSKWKNRTIILAEWQENKHINHNEELLKLSIPEHEMLAIEEHQCKLFIDWAKIQASYLIIRLKKYNLSDRTKILIEHQNIINDFINGIFTFDTVNFPQEITTIKDEDRLFVRKAIKNIEAGIQQSSMLAYDLGSPFFQAYVLFFYKNNILKELTFIDSKTSSLSNEKAKNLPKSKKFSQRQIAIAYRIMSVQITKENYKEILKKHSNTFSSKILQKRIYNIDELAKLSEHKTTDTKYLNDLKQAKRLLISIKKMDKVKDIDRIITAFTTSYESTY